MFIALDSQILAMSQGLLGSIFKNREKTQGKRYQSHLARLKR